MEHGGTSCTSSCISPDGPWSAYVLFIIWMPLLLRILFLVLPFRKAIKKLAPHTGWALKQLRELPVRGFGILAVNENSRIYDSTVCRFDASIVA